MSTRSQIGFFESSDEKITKNVVTLYRHSDGYPDGKAGVLATLVLFAEDFEANRGLSDTQYALARCAQNQTNVHDKYSKYLGFGIIVGLQGDIEYFYHVSPTEIKVYETRKGSPANWTVFKTVKLSAKGA